jgi:hypothetical protein
LKPYRYSFSLLCSLLLCLWVRGQEERVILGEKDAQKITASLDHKAQSSISRLDRANRKYLSKFLKEEKKLYKKLLKKDSSLAKELFAGVEEKYKSLSTAPDKVGKYSNHYSSRLDSLTTSLNFLKAGSSLSKVTGEKLTGTLSKYKDLQARLNGADNIKKFVTERKRLLSDRLKGTPYAKNLDGLKKQAYYYSAQVREYKALFEDPSKWEERLLSLVRGTEQFKEFFRSNSQLGSLFALPGGSSGAGGSGAVTASLQGLQTRASVQASLTQRFGSGPNVTQALQQNMQAAQGELSALKSKLSSLGSGSVGSSEDIDLPQGFKPNGQKTKTFLQRLEYGANLQSRPSSSFVPVTTDFGLSVGYKLSDKSSLGVGAAYTLGWGQSLTNMRVRGEGAAIRSYLDMKLKGSLFITGGYELNYRPSVPERISLSLPGGDFSSWQKSGLVGLSKKYKVSGKLKGDIRLMWDFLSYSQVPRTQAVVFRVGYSLK